MATSLSAVLILWSLGLVLILLEQGLSVLRPRSGALGRCRLHQWMRTGRGFRCSACGWRCEAGGDTDQDRFLVGPP